jgi:hypothetical protein
MIQKPSVGSIVKKVGKKQYSHGQIVKVQKRTVDVKWPDRTIERISCQEIQIVVQ